MAKEAVTITIDRHLHQWIKEKGGNKSRVMNTLLHDCWIRQRDNQQKLPKKVKKIKYCHLKMVLLKLMKNLKMVISILI